VWSTRVEYTYGELEQVKKLCQEVREAGDLHLRAQNVVGQPLQADWSRHTVGGP
jgi:hypothetical protein